MRNAKKTYTTEQIDRARRKLRSYERFKEDNSGTGGAWEYIEGMAERLYQERKPISGRGLIEEVRRHDFTDVEGRPTSINNDYCAPCARDLLNCHPEYEELVELRPCAFDVIMPTLLRDGA